MSASCPAIIIVSDAVDRRRLFDFRNRRSACLAPRCRGDQALQRAVVQPHRIAFALHGEPQYAARPLVRPPRRVADGFLRQPRLVERRLEDDESLRVERRMMEGAHGPYSPRLTGNAESWA